MLANKDKGTGVGFTNSGLGFIDKEGNETVCKEHEWVGFMSALVGDNEVGICCKKCGVKQKTDAISGFVQVICREGEHEFIEVEMTSSYPDSEIDNVTKFKLCKFCGEIEKPILINKVCEHEWVMEIPLGIVYCKKCLLRNSKRDFKIPENLEEINKLKWEDIEKEYEKHPKFLNEYYSFKEFLKENYIVPDKK